MAFPFVCAECEQQPRERFGFFAKTNDWLMAYPERNLIHIHFGTMGVTKETSTMEAQFHWEWLEEVVRQYPEKQWFFIIDLTRKSVNEQLSNEAKEIYKKIRHHPQLAAGAAYGLNFIIRVMMNFFIFFGGANTVLVETKADADARYAEWLKKVCTTTFIEVNSVVASNFS